MKFELLEAAQKKVRNYNAMCEENNRKRSDALQAVSEAKAEEQALMDRQIEGEDVIDELARAQSRVTVEKAKYTRLIESIGETNPEMSIEGISFHTAQSQILAYPNHMLPYDMKNELEAMQEAHDAYLKAAEDALIKFYKLRKEVRGCLAEAEAIFGREVHGSLPVTFDPSVLRPWGLWWDVYDASNAMVETKRRALEIVEGGSLISNPRSVSSVRTIPAPESTLGPKTWVTEDGTVMTRQSEIQIPKPRT
ncbi:hypothetical protein [Exiguobacterium sp. s168]|uniref:hypothetical protein n=1 Tax=Exiguobacterium sp. s168 TaxID=2751194 RepID=UPI001BEA456B|nr:hypothetical protein [Exiguobacterium sp. s168]